MHVCLVAYDALPAIDSSEAGSYGGLETHAWILAQGLARRPDLNVSLVVRHHRPARVSRVNNVQIVTRVDRLFRLRRFVSERIDIQSTTQMSLKRWSWHLLWIMPLLACVRPFRRPAIDPCTADPFFVDLNADVLCAFGVNAVAASVVASATGKYRSLLFLESNADLDEKFAEDPDYINAYGERGDQCRFAIERAGSIVAQNEWQQRQLTEYFHRSATLVNNPFDFDQWNQPEALSVELPAGPFVLWIGRADRFHKRPQILLRVAEQCRELHFTMIMNAGDPEVAAEIALQLPQNVTLIPSIPFQQMASIFQRSSLYVSTGSNQHEGFPNVFLQAAASGVPIVSLEVDPGFVRGDECGEVADGDEAALIESIVRIMADSDLAVRYAHNGRGYVNREHRQEAICESIDLLLIRNAVDSVESP